MNDYIKRSDAIKALEREKSDWNNDYNLPIDNCIKRLNKVKSADRPQGEWTNAGVLTVHCSNCKSELHELEAMNFCPNCGADMRGEKDETD